ncbi:glycosyl hydrolases family 38 N-terminal domain-containing protein [Mycena leptocephala]|nr:glycosyl hydrolases family 38 N-terminal domain-containing protein [Mycena leptocephala]
MNISTAILSAPLPLATTMLVSPTTHNDWDWVQTFGGYYTCSPNGFGVHGILDSVAAILQSNDTTDSDFRFSYAEVAFLRQYLNDDPAKKEIFMSNTERFSLLGGGITSPDNQVTHSEVFIRNYLTGRQYLDSMGLADNVFPVAWVPDDFGHSPQLPVLVEALGMKAIGLSRIPGSIQPELCPRKQPAAADVCANGMSFYWPGRDGSRVLTNFMPSTYYGITHFDRMDAHAGMTGFLGQSAHCVWPGGTIFATEGGDWEFPDSSGAVPGGKQGSLYKWTGVPGPLNSSVAGQLATFADYYDILMNSSTALQNYTLFAENYYTGYFASRPQLKIDHYEAAQLLIGAEVLASILTIYNRTTPAMQAALQAKIAAGWDLLVPTTHHDFVAGTSNDQVYYFGNACGNPAPQGVWDSQGQLFMSGQTVILARDAMNTAMDQLSIVTQSTVESDIEPVVVINDWLASATIDQLPIFEAEQNIVSVVVFNQLGLDLNDTAIVEMDDPSGGMVAYQVVVDGEVGPVQRSWNGKLLFQVPGMLSMAYKVVQLQPSRVGHCSDPTSSFLPQPINNATYVFGNGAVNLTLVQDSGRAIGNMTIGNRWYVQQGAPANRIGVWRDDGNIYQFGMEFIQGNGCVTGNFSLHSPLNAVGPATLLETGPIRWRFNATLNDTFGNLYSTQYDLVRGETLVRINTTGAAPQQYQPYGGWSVVTSFPMRTADGRTATALEYGTSYSWEDREPQKSWPGLTFRATHDFAQLVTTQAGAAVAAVYHNGIPAWTVNATMLHGVLLRNTPGGSRAAEGTDNGTHSQYYTLDVESQLANTGHPLRTALYAQTPLRAVPLAQGPPKGPQMPAAAQLASASPADVVLAVGKTNGTSGTLVLRIQRSNATSEVVWIEVPWRNDTMLPPSIVSALETPIDSAPPVRASKTSLSFRANRGLMTMEVPF